MSGIKSMLYKTNKIQNNFYTYTYVCDWFSLNKNTLT